MTPEAGTTAAWRTLPGELADDAALGAVVIAVHQDLLAGPLAGDPMLNQALPVQCRALRRVEEWRLVLLLTPWMFARLLFPDRPPVSGLPAGWGAAERAGADYLVLGPSLRFTLLGQPQQAHLNYCPRLGHYLVQPICLDMQPYADPESVFEDWNQVIRTRDENMEQARRECALQREVSRREFFARVTAG
jgi:hypothetical protein